MKWGNGVRSFLDYIHSSMNYIFPPALYPLLFYFEISNNAFQLFDNLKTQNKTLARKVLNQTAPLTIIKPSTVGYSRFHASP